MPFDLTNSLLQAGSLEEACTIAQDYTSADLMAVELDLQEIEADLNELRHSEAAIVAVDQARSVVMETVSFQCGRVGVSPESDYFLTGSFGCLYLTADVNAFVYRGGLNLDRFLDNYEWPRDNGLWECCRDIRRHFDDWQQSAPIEDRIETAISLLYGFSEQYRDFFWELSDNAVVGAILTGGNAETFDFDLELEKLPRLQTWVDDISSGVALLHDAYSSIDRPKLLRQLQASIARPGCDFDQITVTPRDTNKSKLTRRRNRQVRQAIKKSTRLFKQHIGEVQLRQFLNGESIVFEGKLFHYRVTKTQNVISHTADPKSGHIPYDLSMVDPQTGKDLCKICVYLDETPVLDQIVAISLYVRSDEETLLERGNMFSRTDEFETNQEMIRIGKARGHVGDSDLAPVGAFQITPGDDLVSIKGVTSTVFHEQVVPWRMRHRPAITELLSRRSGLSIEQIEHLWGRDRRIDELVFSQQLPETVQELIAAV